MVWSSLIPRLQYGLGTRLNVVTKINAITATQPVILYTVDVHLCSVTFSLKKSTPFFTSTVVGFTSTGPSVSGVCTCVNGRQDLSIWLPGEIHL